MSETAIEEMSFEQAMRALEEVVGHLEKGDVPLERSIELYERGALLKARCAATLAAAEEKVARITTDAGGAARGTEPLDP
ncbi:exodeoxyribonuclease VII small subunit [Palleronia rufa]|nr:exodeoxyribonuclease VII small subunit [Palleronia rufa]